MKQKLLFSLITVLFSTFLVIAQTRTGINTTTPRKTLEVNGTTKISGNLDIGTINTIDNSDTYTFLMQEPTQKIKALDAATATEGNALGYFMRYTIRNVNWDWISDFDTGINSTNFTVVVISARFTEILDDAVGVDHFSIPIVPAFITGATWHLKADYPAVSTYSGANGDWQIKLLIISKDLIKTFPDQIENMGGATTGTAATPLLN